MSKVVSKLLILLRRESHYVSKAGVGFLGSREPSGPTSLVTRTVQDCHHTGLSSGLCLGFLGFCFLFVYVFVFFFLELISQI